MCGIVAWSRGSVDPLMADIAHRGVRSKIVHGQRGSLGHVRLPIVGLDPQFDQPIQVGKWAVAFVGEILDFREDDPEAQCDLEVIRKKWDSEGGGIDLQQRDGFWSVVGLNVETGDLCITCDYLAQKPMYFRLDSPAAASEITPLLRIAPNILDEVYLGAVAKWGYCPETWRTPFRQIHRVLPGGEVHISAKNGRVIKRVVDHIRPLRMTDMEIKQEIELAVKRRVLSSDVSVAILVSGGLDSAITYSLAQRYGNVRPFHVENGELWAAEEVIGNRSFTVVNLSPTPLAHCLDYMEEPLDLGSLVPQVCLSDALGPQYSVCLTGDGADELFGGYGRSMRFDSQASDVYHELVGYHLPRLDRVMMRNRIEVRSPFLSRAVVRGAMALPWNKRQDKGMLRYLFADDLGEKVAKREKRPLRAESFDREERSLQLIELLRGKHA